MTFLFKNLSTRKKKIIYKCKKFTLFPNLIIKCCRLFMWVFCLLQVVFCRRFFFSPLIWGDGGEEVQKNVYF